MDAPSTAEIRRAQLRVAAIREDISTRLWPVNAGMSSLMFNDLMDRMALLQFNCERRYSEQLREGDRRLGLIDRRSLGSILSARRSKVDEAPKEDPH
ncbi:hypothetical protein BH11GEM1_BH11GEM1_05970 [soil metagenome]